MTLLRSGRNGRGRARRRVLASLLMLAAVAPTSAATAAPEQSSAPCIPLTLPRQAGPDPRHFVDGCGGEFFAEGRPAGQPAATPASRRHGGPAAPLRDTFDLESRPGSDRTLYLRFTGTTLQDTAWNSDYALPSIRVAPFSLTPPLDTRFSARELQEIQRAWQVTAEDFAPFDINVTTRPPTEDALTRSSEDDPTYGATVLVTRGGPLLDACQCGGLAYAGVFSDVGAAKDFYQPALVFGRDGYDIGEAASHEAGHTFGLMHDGTASSPYYRGREPWGAIMGSGYGLGVTQWSQGEYAGANNQQDDVAIIAAGAPLRTDDHGDTPETATPLLAGSPATGVIGSRTDADAFTFTARGRVGLTATPASPRPDLDIGLRILDATGATVALVDPAVRSSWGSVSGLSATWTAVLPRQPATYTAVVDGVGSGSPLVAGRYSDYGSLGGYRITLATR